MPKERGKEWKHVKVQKTNKNNHLVECSYCQKQFWVGSGSRIRAYLGVETINGVTRCEKVPEDVVTSLTKAENKKLAETSEVARKRSIDAKFSSATLRGEGSTSDAKQLKITTMCSKRLKSDVDEAVARMCYSTGVSFNVVNNKHFREMCQKIGEYGPSYQVPSDYPIRTTLLEKEYSKVCRRIDQFHSDHLTRTGGTIVSDGWSDAQRRPLLNFLLVTPSGPTYLKSEDSSGEIKDAVYIAKHICEAIDQVGPENVFQVITDSAANCKAAWTIISAKYPKITCSPCAAHCLDLLLEDWGKLSFASIIDDATDVVKFITGHDGSRALMKKHSPSRGLLKPAATRFGSKIIMLERLVDLKDNLQEMVASRKYKAWVLKRSLQDASSPISKHITSDNFWHRCQLYLDINKPVYELLRLLDGCSPVIGKVYYRMFDIQEKINNFKGITMQQRQDLYQSFVNRWAMLHTELHAAGFLLDPEYVHMAQHSNEEVMNGFYKLVEKMFGDAQEQVLLANQLTQFRCGHGIFGRPIAKAATGTMPAYQWWLNFGASVPELQSFAVRVLSQTATSSEAERNWSLFGFVQNKRRCSLKTTTMDKLVYIHANTRLVDKVNEVDYEETNVGWQNDLHGDSLSDAGSHSDSDQSGSESDSD
jgi:Protein of unknown function (DUF 659)/hAT family C-terminal dimerisation region